MIKLVVGAVAGVLALGLVVGCGGSDDDSSSLTKQEFTKQASRICKRGGNERLKIIRAAGKNLAPGETISNAVQEKVFSETLPSYRSMAGEIEELGTPEGEEAKAERLVSAMEKSADEAEANLRAVVVDDEAIFGEANEIAKELGLTDCQL